MDLQSKLNEFNSVIVSSLSNDRNTRNKATQTLEKLRLDEATTTILLQYIQSPGFSEQNRLLAAVQLKNIIKKVYGQHSFTHYDEKANAGSSGIEDDERIDQNGLLILQNNLVNLLLTSPKPFAQQFLEMISLMGKKYVQNEWPTLIPGLVQHLKTSQDPNVIQLALEAFKKICKKYRYMFRSDALYTEMNYVITNLSEQLLAQALNCLEIAKTNTENTDMIKVVFGILNSILHIIESILSQEELPDFYEDNLPVIAEIMAYIVDTDFPKLQRVPDEIIKARSKVVRLVTLYSFKFAESFTNYVSPFFEKIWNMVCNNKVAPTKQNEKLIQAVVRYLSEMAGHPSFHEFFRANMLPLFNLIIVPNIAITNDDIDEYSDEPETYIRNDLEESDSETRRRQCMKFVQSLSKKFQNEVNQLISDYVNNLLAEYQANRQNEWIKKSTVLNLIITASIGAYSYRTGATDLVISYESLSQYLEQLVLPELQETQIDNLPLLKATCIKFIYMFRNQIPDSYVPLFVDKVADFLQSQSPVNQSYAAACIEKLLIRKTNNNTGVPILTADIVDMTMIHKLLQNLCVVLNDNKNLYAIRALFRTIHLAQTRVEAFAKTLGEVFSSFITEAAKDEKSASPNYLYILFETTALTLRYTKQNKASTAELELELTKGINNIIQGNVQDLMGYCFQIYAALVACSDQLQKNYEVLTASILQNTDNWNQDMKWLIPSLAQFLIAMIFKYPDFVKNFTDQLQQIIGHLMSSAIRQETVGIQIGLALFEKLGLFDLEFLHKFLFSIFSSLHFYRNNTKTKTIPIPITKSMHACFATLMVNHGSQAVITACNKIQPEILFMVLKSEGDKIKHVVSPARDRRYTIIAYSQLMTEAQMPQEVLQILASSLVELCALNLTTEFFQVASTIHSDTEDFLNDGAIDQTFAFQRSSYIPLNAAKIEQNDKLEAEVPQAELYFLKCLNQVCQGLRADPAQILLGEKYVNGLALLCQKHGYTFQ